ncbi:MAG: DUF4301 family protein [Bacteroidales bacterium]|nr:DUF4301 family protein [Bacteroidales bacterium]MCF8343387.1 DUF4301 family protein [Bacteroidales bacterium]MCF8351728.1 DUF4301 family protein [Bacteroidales bacterium]MCF8377558.1 DUF4301 family protein [Bacteroidales bacterium]MCF8401711.1 DUF4301 family protein [Bacteroidales bacterium]
MFSQKDRQQIEAKGIGLETIQKQIEHFEEGFPWVRLVEPARVGNGIISFNDEEIEALEKSYNLHSGQKDVLKFVPASGAATRMFKHLFAFLEKYENNEEGHKYYLSDKEFNSVYYFITNIQKFAFYNELKEIMKADGLDLEDCIKNQDYDVVIDYVLNEKGLNYASLPKGLIKFHDYPDGARKSVEEHLVETANYCRDRKGKVHLHFTVSPEHIDHFKQTIKEVKGKYEKQLNVEFEIEFSVQKPSTDTIAVDMENKPFREVDDSMLFRPGGHGALIENLNDIDHDIIFIKNIDNIVPDKLRDETYRYKRVIGGHLISIQEKAFRYLEKLEGDFADMQLLEEIADFATNDLTIDIPKDFNNYGSAEKKEFLFRKLNRPIRVCGMVKNEGEPGGGPFWVKQKNGEISLQIVEKSQINLDDSGQQMILNQSTHFNPVDIVCSIRNYKGKAFDLHEFVDPETGFISIKSKNGRSLKAQELPGLWNGAMADWNTVFVETPIITFNPVKTVNDLLRPTHQ